MTAQNRKNVSSKTSDYQPTPQEIEAVRKFTDGKSKRSPEVKASLSGEGLLTLALDHPDKFIGQVRLMEAFGTDDLCFYEGLMMQIVNLTSRSRKINEQAMNFILSIIKGIEPKDQVESMLATQMAAVHMEIMTCARRLATAETIPQQDSAERAFNKLARTFAAQMEALKRYRTGGEQKVTVQHVNVAEGGQAIVGNVTQRPNEAAPDKRSISQPALGAPKATAMTNLAESKKQGRVPVPRRLRK